MTKCYLVVHEPKEVHVPMDDKKETIWFLRHKNLFTKCFTVVQNESGILIKILVKATN